MYALTKSLFPCLGLQSSYKKYHRIDLLRKLGMQLDNWTRTSADSEIMRVINRPEITFI